MTLFYFTRKELNRVGLKTALFLFNGRFEKKGNRRPFRIVGRNLNALRELARPPLRINFCRDLAFFSGFYMVRTGHRRRTSSGGTHLFDDKLLISGVRKIKNVL